MPAIPETRDRAAFFKSEVSPIGMKIIDAHQHFWDLDQVYYRWLCDEIPPDHRYGNHKKIRRTFLPDDYFRGAKDFDVVATVHVEALADQEYALAETEWLSGLRERTGWPTVAVAQVPLMEEGAPSLLEAQSRYGFVRGIRCLPGPSHAGPHAHQRNPGALDDPLWRKHFALLEAFGFSCDLFVPYRDLPGLADLAGSFPGIQIVLNHAGNPSDRSAEGMAAWREGLAMVAQHKNVSVKLSGIGIEAGRWDKEEALPILDTVVELFGPSRCMFASNFPPDSLLASFSEIYATYCDFAGALSPAEQEQLFLGTAQRVYRIDLSV